MDKDTYEILDRQDKISSRMFYLACILSFLLFASIINTNVLINKSVETMEKSVTEISSIKADEVKEIVRLYFETDYDFGEYEQNITQTQTVD